MKKLLNKLRSYSSVIIYAAACLFLFSGLIIQFYSHYSSQTANAVKAIKLSQRFVIDAERILYNNPEIEHNETVKTFQEKISQLPANAPEIAVIVTDLGQDKDIIDAAFRLPPEIGVSFSPYTVDLYEQSRIASTLGHSVFIDIPLEVAGKDMGKFEISTKNNPFRNLQNIEAIFSKSKNTRGVVAPVDENFSSSDSFRMVLDILAEKDISLVYPGLNKEKVSKESANAHVKLLKSPTMLSDASKLEDLEKTASSNGYALGVVSASVENIKALDEWQKKLIAKKIRLVSPEDE